LRVEANDLLPVIRPPDGEGVAQCPEDAYDRNVVPRVLVSWSHGSGFRVQGSGLSGSEPVARDGPIAGALQPIVETLGLDDFRHPVGLCVVGDKAVADRLDLI